MDGSTSGQITSTLISLLPGNYTLAFDILGSERGSATSATVTLGTFYNHTFNLNSTDSNSVSFDFSVPSATTGNIVFTSNDSPGAIEGALVDNVSLSFSASSGIPEPWSALLLLAGMPLAWAFRKRLAR